MSKEKFCHKKSFSDAARFYLFKISIAWRTFVFLNAIQDYKIINNSCDFLVGLLANWRKWRKTFPYECLHASRTSNWNQLGRLWMAKWSQNIAHNVTDNIILPLFILHYIFTVRIFCHFLLLLLLLTFVFCLFYGIPSGGKAKILHEHFHNIILKWCKRRREA